MKQVLQDARTGEVAVVSVPAPKLLAGCVLVRVASSLVSAGTERASSDFARKNLFQKAKARPDLVRQVLSKVRRDGLMSTVAAVRSRLDQPTALGYSSAGAVVAVGEGVTDITVGDRVACAGAGYAIHGEFACVPRLLVARIPDPHIGIEEAAFSTMGAIALHGIRTADVKLGDVVAVIGLGLLGQLTVQILKAAGCRVIGTDIVAERVELARECGADAASSSSSEFHEMCMRHSVGRGVDAVLITAQTPSSDLVNFAAEIARDRGVIVAVGAVGMDIKRKLFYEKELDLRVSRSYGPGRYDSAYEQKGIDYPIGYVRWTETRNMEAFLQLLAERKVRTEPLVTHRFSIEEADRAYEVITGRTQQPSLGVMITYPADAEQNAVEVLSGLPTTPLPAAQVSVGLLGAGDFAMSTLLPAMRQVEGLELIGVCAANGAHSRHAAAKFGFRYCATDQDRILSDPAINAVVIATRHHLHATQVLAALQAGKHVFCEKPLCLTEEELFAIVRAYQGLSPIRPLLMVGFNRRCAPLALRMKAFLQQIQEPLALHYRVNAGFIPADHWVNDPAQGGGRILGEVCHFVDFLAWLVGASPATVKTRSLPNPGKYADDNVIVSLQFPNGSQGTITYVANGDKSYSKERVEVFGGGAVAVLEDFRRLELVRHGRKQVVRSLWRQDKGHAGEWRLFAKAIRAGEEAPVPFDEVVATTLATLRIAESRCSGDMAEVHAADFIASASAN
jgi:predicted dehydrogenase/threonine dehydrogenase-like Zn-dependent dehydrogenase